MIPLPNLVSPFVNATRNLIAPWNFYLQQFTQAPPNVADIVVGASPFSYVSKEPGNVSVTGGTVSVTILTRGLINLDVSGQKLIPVSIGDAVTVVYSVIPTLKFLANYGQNTGAQ